MALHEHTRDRFLATVEMALGRSEAGASATSPDVLVPSRHLPPSGGHFHLDGVGQLFGPALTEFPGPIALDADRVTMAGWDNTARHGPNATIFHGASPEAFEEWFRALVTVARRRPPRQRLVFVNAWNEWAEGAHLEPDTRFGTGYLEATRRALAP